MKGVVRWFNPEKGYGFISNYEEAEEDIFVGRLDIKSHNEYKSLKEGDIVEFILGNNTKGLCAKEVIKV